MIRVIFILLIIFNGQLFSQENDTLKFDKIFGCSCCADTITDLFDKARTYVITDFESTVTAYKSGKSKWSFSIYNSFGDRYVRITCIELYSIKKRIVLRLYVDDPGFDSRTEYVDIDRKSGKALTVKNKYAQ